MITDKVVNVPRYRALVGPSGVPTSEYSDLHSARAAVIQAINFAAEMSPPDAPELDGVLVRLRAADGDFVDYFQVDGIAWTAQFWPVEEE